MTRSTIFVIDDEEVIREGIAVALERDYSIKPFGTAESALENMEHDSPDLVLLDIGLPGMDGIQTLKEIKSRDSDIPVIMITAYEDVQTVISAMKLGAHDYVVKPIHMDALEVSIRNVLETVKLKKEVQALQEKYLKENLPCFIGESNAIQDVMEFIDQVAKSPDTPILIIGETGTGKELIASAIHYRSPNFSGPLVTVNCAAIPKDLVESELFGYEKGAFSGASPSGKIGLVEEAAGGTLFLDEVGDLSQEAQAKLLRFLEDGQFYRVGGTRQRKVQTRVVSATNKDLEDMVKEGHFRKDLYFRLGVIRVEVPSLNERKDDIMPLAQAFLLEFNKKFGKKITGLSRDAENGLLGHTWTGHVRELRNLIERGVLISSGPELTVEDLGIAGKGGPKHGAPKGETMTFPPFPQEGMDLEKTKEAFERYFIEQAFNLAKGNESKAARLLNMNHHTYRYRRRKLLGL
ncbi:MAG: sigma-54-dependent Fis family transcriptional regulator [Deltaproteobacteria bacterium]|nr:MAG: sigma-54-dependent Fis family transcriptional regulator [Deltaproteobacteria bacterium]